MHPDMYRRMHFPTFHAWGELRSVFVEFIWATLDTMSQDVGFDELARRVVEAWKQEDSSIPGFEWRQNVAKILAARPTFWSVCSLESAIEMSLMVDPLFFELLELGTKSSRMDNKYSAASSAIRFLESVPRTSWKHFRSIKLIEDEVSMVISVSHSLGLVPFCRLNPKARVERVVNVWKVAITPEFSTAMNPLQTSSIIKALGRWILETSRLSQRGMPDGSYRLILDGNSTPEKTSEAFQVMNESIALQAAFELCYDREIFSQPTWVEFYTRNFYYWGALYRALKRLESGDYASLIQCNFNTGVVPARENLLEHRSEWSVEEWLQEWDDNQVQIFETDAPLPPFMELHNFCKFLPHRFL